MLLNRFFEFEKKKQQQNVGINMNDILILYRWILKLYTAILRAKIIGARVVVGFLCWGTSNN